MDPLVGLEDVDWSALEHAYGDASNLPEWLRRLFDEDPEQRTEAIVYLRQSVYHQSGAYSAAPAVVPFLLQALGADPPADRVGLLSLLGLLSEGHRLRHGLSSRLLPWPGYYEYFSEVETQEYFPAAYAAVERGGPRLLALLDDPELEVVAAAARVCVGFESLAPRVGPVVARALSRPGASPSRGSLALSLGMACRLGAPRAGLAALDPLRTAEDSTLRLAATLARIWAREPLDASDDEALRQALGPDGRSIDRLGLWGDPERLVGHALYYRLAEGDEAMGALLLDAIETAAAAWPARGNQALAADALLLALRITALEPRIDGPLTAPMSPGQEALLRALCRHLAPPALTSFFGLSGERLLRDLGLPPPASLHEHLGEPPPPPSANGPGAGLLDIEQALALESMTVDAAIDAAEREPPREAWHAALRAQAEARARLGPLAGTKAVGCRATSLWLAALLTRVAHRAEADPDPVVEALLTTDPLSMSFAELTPLHREVIASLPAPRRATVIQDVWHGSHQEPSEAWSLYDLAPCAAHLPRMLELFEEWPEFFEGAAAYRAILVLAAIAEVAPRPLADALADEGTPLRHLLAAAWLHRADPTPLVDLIHDVDPRVRRLAQASMTEAEVDLRALLGDIGVQASVERAPTRGGVIGRDGKRWDGKLWR